MIAHIRSIGLAAALLCGLSASAYALELNSPAFSNGGALPKAQVFEGMGCNGGNTSPALSWSGAPKGTKSFALTLYDPDAPTGSGWWHWVVVNIPPNVTKLAKGASNGHMPKGAVQARNDYGMSKFGGACPPPGKPHHYIFTIYALDTAKLPVKPAASGAMAGFNIHAHIIDRATLTAIYGR